MIPGHISRYRILSKLGSGGMGEVYLGEDTTLGRNVAVKFLRPESLGDEMAKKRLIREARAAATLDHPNICTVYEVGEEDQVSFIVMQYIEGETLDCVIRRGPIDEKQAVYLAIQIADALAEAHSHHIVHRDIKPHNIMITPRGQARLMDFGLAKLRPQTLTADTSDATESLITAPGHIVGTLPYMSPEQLRGEELDAASDIFSLGAVLYEMLTGRRAFDAKTDVEIISAILSGEPAPIAQIVTAAHPELSAIVRRAMAKERNSRHQQAVELLSDLNRLMRDYDSLAAQPQGQPAAASTSTATAVSTIPDATPASIQPEGPLPAPRVSRRRSTRSIDSLAVLPLANAGDDTGTEYLSDGITTSIINSLSLLPRLRVMARSTVFRYKNRDLDAQAIGRELGVRAVVTGRVIQFGDSLVVRTELVDVDDGSQLWGEQYDRKSSDIIAVQEEIASAIVEKLRLKMTGSERRRLTKRYTANTEAYRLYLKGLYQVGKGSVEGNLKSIEYFNLALEADPTYALAFTGMADAYVWLAHMYLHPREAFPKAKSAVTRALAIDDKIAEAHSILALVKMYFEHDWRGAERAFSRARDLNLNDASMLRQYGFYLSVIGRSDEAIAQIQRAQEIDPLSIVLNAVLGWVYYFSRRADDAIAQFRTTLDLAPNFYNAAWGLGQSYLQKGQLAEAMAHFQNATEMSARFMPETISSIALVNGLSNQPDEARRLIVELDELSRRRHVSPFSLAQAYLGLGETDRVFECLEQAYQDRFGWMISIRVSTVWDSVRADPRFQSLLHRINFPN
jgi:eukaryotic-like serine/threonine-protein kinase